MGNKRWRRRGEREMVRGIKKDKGRKQSGRIMRGKHWEEGGKS